MGWPSMLHSSYNLGFVSVSETEILRSSRVSYHWCAAIFSPCSTQSITRRFAASILSRLNLMYTPVILDPCTWPSASLIVSFGISKSDAYVAQLYRAQYDVIAGSMGCIIGKWFLVYWGLPPTTLTGPIFRSAAFRCAM